MRNRCIHQIFATCILYILPTYAEVNAQADIEPNWPGKFRPTHQEPKAIEGKDTKQWMSVLQSAEGDEKVAAIEALGFMGTNAAKASSLLLTTAQDATLSPSTRRQALHSFRLTKPAVSHSLIDVLLDLLRNDQSVIRREAGDALMSLDLTGVQLSDDIAATLTHQYVEARWHAAMAISMSHPVGGVMPILLDMLQNDLDDSVQRAAAYALAGYGLTAHEASTVIPRILAWIEEDWPDTSVFALLGSYGRTAAPYLDDIAEYLSHENSNPTRQEYTITSSARTIADIANDLAIHRADLSMDALRSSVKCLTSALRQMEEAIDAGLVTFSRSEYVASSYRQTERAIQPLKGEIDRREAVRTTAQVAIVAATITAILLSGYAVILHSVGILRWWQEKVGYEWQFDTGIPDCRLRVRPCSDDQQSVEIEFETASVGLTILPPQTIGSFQNEAPLKTLQPRLAKKTVRVEVDHRIFGHPWCKYLSSGLSIPGAPILGQRPLGLGDVSSKPVGRVRIAVLGCQLAHNGLPSLTRVDHEVAAISRSCKSWGAQMLDYDNRSSLLHATAESFGNALVDADIVHVAAHANPNQLHFANASYSVDSLRHIEAPLRARLLIFSVCEIGDLAAIDTSLLYHLIKSGANVVCTAARIHDRVGRDFFSAFYSSLLSGFQVQHVNIAHAIRKAIQVSRDLWTDENDVEWRRSINGLLLFGDPTLHLTGNRKAYSWTKLIRLDCRNLRRSRSNGRPSNVY